MSGRDILPDRVVVEGGRNTRNNSQCKNYSRREIDGLKKDHHRITNDDKFGLAFLSSMPFSVLVVR